MAITCIVSRSRVRTPETAEEIVQEAMLAALKARHSFRGQCTERSWLTAILKRKVIDWLRKTVRQRLRQDAPHDKGVDAHFTSSGKWLKKPDEWSTDDPGHDLTVTEFRRVLSDCLSKLPPRVRDAFILRYMDEQTAEEVGKALGAKAANLWVMLHRARFRLWKCLTINWFAENPDSDSREDAP